MPLRSLTDGQILQLLQNSAGDAFGDNKTRSESDFYEKYEKLNTKSLFELK